MQITCKLFFSGLGRSAMRSAIFFEGPLYLAFFCQKIRFSYTYETRGRVILKIYSCKHASKQIKKPEFRSFDCYISLIYMVVTSKSAPFAFLLSYLCTVKRQKRGQRRLGSLERPLNVAAAPQRGASSPLATEGNPKQPQSRR